MFTVTLLFLVIVLAAACCLLLLVLIESRELPGRHPLKAWRHAWSKRKEIQTARRSARQADARAREAYKRMVWEQAEAERAKAQANEQIQANESAVAARLARMGSFIIAEQCGEHIKSIKASNYHAKEKKILRSIKVAAKNGYKLPKDDQRQLVSMLKQAHEKHCALRKRSKSRRKLRN
ncbi:MAG: hypothetical protein AAGH88_07140 [Planctomycetota bacterium]